MNSARDAGGRPPKLDLIHRLQSCTNDAGHNANLTYRETLSIMVTARYECKVSLRREIRLQDLRTVQPDKASSSYNSNEIELPRGESAQVSEAMRRPLRDLVLSSVHAKSKVPLIAMIICLK
jgi:hypothetical protein